MVKKVSILLLITAICSLTAQASDKEPAESDIDMSSWHLGAELDMMPGGPEMGSMLPFVYFSYGKFAYSLGGNYYRFNDDLQGQSRVWQGETRATYRIDLAPWSYVDTGIDYSWQWGTQNGAAIGTNYSTGPMIGLTRQFPHTGFFFTAFVVVVQYIKVDAVEQNSRGNGWGFFENGGVGIRYLF